MMTELDSLKEIVSLTLRCKRRQSILKSSIETGDIVKMRAAIDSCQAEFDRDTLRMIELGIDISDFGLGAHDNEQSQ